MLETQLAVLILLINYYCHHSHRHFICQHQYTTARTEHSNIGRNLPLHDLDGV